MTNRSDVVFRRTTATAATVVLLLVAAIVAFLAVQAAPALSRAGISFLGEQSWFPDEAPPEFGVATLVFGTVVSSAGALLIAMPIALGTALFITELAPRRLGRWVGYLIDLLAAVPSVVFGLWGVVVLVPLLEPASRAINAVLGFIPVFANPSDSYGRSLFAASVVLAIMILPIIAALVREVFVQVPRSHKEAALSLGATRWEMIRLAILPYGRAGVFGAAMIGLGRALGETIAVALVLFSAYEINLRIFEPGGNTIAANIATKFAESGAAGREALIASGLVLFVITLVVNGTGRRVVSKPTRVRS